MTTITAYAPEHIQRYGNFTPTSFDPHICNELDHLYIAPAGLNRDSGILQTSNWEVVTQDILGKATHDETQIHRFGHWACGWFELLLVHPNDDAALQCADEWAASLSDYPVASDEHFSEMEWEAKVEYWGNCSVSERVELCQQAGVSIFAARHDHIPGDVDMYISID